MTDPIPFRPRRATLRVAGRDYAIKNDWFEIDESGTKITLTPGGEDA